MSGDTSTTSRNVAAAGDQTDSLENTTSANEVLAHQESVAQARALIERIEALIARKQAHVAAASAELGVPADRSRQRADVLARIELGETAASELETLDAEIEDEERMRSEAAAVMGPDLAKGALTIDGLKTRLLEAEQRLRHLEDSRNEVLLAFVQDEAERVASTYVEAATRLARSWLQLMALERLAHKYGGYRQHFMTLDSSKIFVPGFRFPACIEAAQASYYGDAGPIMFSDRFAGKQVEDTIDSELERFRQLGIQV